MTEEIQEVECARCGINGTPSPHCEFCHGNAPTQTRGYTLTDVRGGRAPKDDRYGHNGAVEPRKIRLPGSGG